MKSRQQDTENESRGFSDRISNIIVTVLLVALMSFVVYAMVCTGRGKAVKLFGKSMLTVITGSMEPSIQTGDYILIEDTDPSQLKEGDIIAFYSEQSDVYGMLVTHRIIAVNDDGTFVTKGDANPIEDSLNVRPDQIAGRYTGKARLFIWLSSFADPHKLLMLLVIIPLTLIAVYEVRTVTKLGKEAEREHDEEMHEKLMREAIEQEIKRLEQENYKPQDDDGDEEPKDDDAAENDDTPRDGNDEIEEDSAEDEEPTDDGGVEEEEITPEGGEKGEEPVEPRDDNEKEND